MFTGFFSSGECSSQVLVCTAFHVYWMQCSSNAEVSLKVPFLASFAHHLDNIGIDIHHPFKKGAVFHLEKNKGNLI